MVSDVTLNCSEGQLILVKSCQLFESPPVCTTVHVLSVFPHSSVYCF